MLTGSLSFFFIPLFPVFCPPYSHWGRIKYGIRLLRGDCAFPGILDNLVVLCLSYVIFMRSRIAVVRYDWLADCGFVMEAAASRQVIGGARSRVYAVNPRNPI